MVGKMKGVVSRILKVATRANSSHCILHRHVTKKNSTNLKNVMDEAVKMINYVKSGPLPSRLFKILCNEMGSGYKALLLHTEVRLVSRGKALLRLNELRELLVSLRAQHNLQQHFIDLVG
ncbi:zinc finger BED domain-containing protein 5-like [Arctopsyche grandis]|uniref:zinc finger BED domain-containing protein 5-like n=1 Tax=Arctopsyche grandis TaxID=121162 RepID=UPI00406D9E44